MGMSVLYEVSETKRVYTLRKRVKNVVTSTGNSSGDSVLIREVMWSEVMWSELIWFTWSDFVFKWSELSYGEYFWDKSTTYIRVTLFWGYLIVLWLFHLVCILYCGCFNLFCNVLVCVCMGFVMCGCVCVCVFCNVWLCVCVGFVMCGCVYVWGL